jgi:hypothetical protein
MQKNWVFLSFFSFSKLWKVKKTKLEKEIELDWKKVTGERGKAFSTNVQQNFQMCSEKMTETTFFETIIYLVEMNILEAKSLKPTRQ